MAQLGNLFLHFISGKFENVDNAPTKAFKCCYYNDKLTLKTGKQLNGKSYINEQRYIMNADASRQPDGFTACSSETLMLKCLSHNSHRER